MLPKESFLLPPEGQDIECDENELHEQVKKIAAEAARRLAEKNKNGNVILEFDILSNSPRYLNLEK